MRVVGVTSMSKESVDFRTGGLTFFDKTGAKKNMELFIEPGDMVVFYPTLYHSVEPVDPEAPLNWDFDAGRWTILFVSIDSHLVPNRATSLPCNPNLV